MYLGLAGLAYTFIAVFLTMTSDDPLHLYVVIGIWAIAPPLWFWAEYFFLYEWEKDSFERFRYGQQVSAAIWAGVLAALLGFAAAEPWSSGEHVTRPSRSAVFELKTNLLDAVRTAAAKDGVSIAVVAQSVEIPEVIAAAVLGEMKNVERFNQDDAVVWRVKK